MMQPRPLSSTPGDLVAMWEDPPIRKPARRWRDKFNDAFRGMKLGIRGHSSFYVHFFSTAMVCAAAIAFDCSALDWCILIGCIGLVMTTELINSAIETLFHGLDPDSKNRIQGCLDIAAGAVLMASFTAIIIGAIVFIRRLVILELI